MCPKKAGISAPTLIVQSGIEPPDCTYKHLIAIPYKVRVHTARFGTMNAVVRLNLSKETIY